MLFSYDIGQQRIDDDKKCRQIARNFYCHADVAVQRGSHRPMEHIQGFTWSHWMLPLVKCLCRIAPAAAMVDKFERNTQNTNKTQLLASNYGTFWLLVVQRILGPEMDPLLSSLMRQASFKCEATWLEPKSSRTFPAIKTLSGDKK